MSIIQYKIQKSDRKRWGIYLQDRLLATIGSYQACQFISKSLSNKLSSSDKIKAEIAYEKTMKLNNKRKNYLTNFVPIIPKNA